MFKVCGILVSWFLVLTQSQPQGLVPGNLLISTTGVSPIKNVQTYSNTGHTCPPSVKGLICSNDCSTLLTCGTKNSNVPLAQFACAAVSANQPFCNVGATSCSAVADPNDANCPQHRSNFVCTDFGLFPEPGNCSRYNNCTNDGFADSWECPNPYVYEPVSGKCTLPTEDNCFTIDCNNQTSYPSYLPYAGHKAYYAICLSSVDGVVSTVMLKCHDTEYFEFNLDTLNCEFKCPGEGFYQDKTDNTKYFVCSQSQWTHRSCPQGTLFDRSRGTCIHAAV